MADDSDIEWLNFKAAIDRAQQFAGDRHLGTRLLLEHMFAGRIRAISKLTVIESPSRGSHPNRQEARDWCLLPSFWVEWKGEQQLNDVPELGRFVAVRSVFNPSVRYDHYSTEAHGVKLCTADVDEWFPSKPEPQPDELVQVKSNGTTKHPGGKKAGKAGAAHASFTIRLQRMSPEDLSSIKVEALAEMLKEDYVKHDLRVPPDQNLETWATSIRTEVLSTVS